MRRISGFWRGMAAIALVAVLIVVLDQQRSLVTAGTLLSVAFYLAIAVVCYLFWRDLGRREIATWPRRQQFVIYGALALFLADLGWWFSVSLSGRDLLAFILVAAACVVVGVRTWREQHRYS
jgi:hypothetical protein